MRGLAGCGDDDLEAAVRGGRGPLVDLVGRAMGARDDELVGNAELVELTHACLHGGHVRLGTHDDANERLICHVRSSGWCLYVCVARTRKLQV